MWTWNFWKQALERAIKTAAQVAAALLGVAGLGFLDVDWRSVASVVGLAVVASLLSSIGSAGVGPAGSASAVAVAPNPVPVPVAPVVAPVPEQATSPEDETLVNEEVSDEVIADGDGPETEPAPVK